MDPTREMLVELSGKRPGARRGLLGGRRLTAGEKQHLEIFFGRKLASGKVRVHANHLPGVWAMCLDNHIFFSASTYRPDFAAPGKGSRLDDGQAAMSTSTTSTRRRA